MNFLILIFTVARTSNLAVEALAGLASVEDFKSVSLKSSSLPLNQSWLPYKPLMLIHIKGRTHIQSRLVEPTYKSINQGDCFVLIANNKLYRYVGKLSNVIEKARSKSICAAIVENKDLGCSASHEHVIDDNNSGDRIGLEFWSILGRPADGTIADCGHADEDDLFETSLIETNMMYEYQDEKLMPIDKYWGSVPKIEMLDSRKVLLFNFGSEVYVWNGKNATSESKRGALRLTQELFANAYDYEMCDVNPLNYSQIAGARDHSSAITKLPRSGSKKPDWCLLSKVTQNMETILFREKFLDWPEYERNELEKNYLLNGKREISPLDGAKLFAGDPYTEPNLQLEMSNVGRGNFYYDTETMRHFDILTQSVDKWQVNEYNFDDMAKDTYGHFYSSESYIIRWIYRISITVRELTGQISKRNTVGRDRCVYFCWQGVDASANEKGSAALLTVELDKEKGTQMRLTQGEEPTAFLRLFKIMILHRGKRDELMKQRANWRLFIVLGNDVNETLLSEVDCNRSQLRSRTSMLLVNGRTGKIILWHGIKSSAHTKDVARACAEEIQKSRPIELFIAEDVCVNGVQLETMIEGSETDGFSVAINKAGGEYFSLLESSIKTFNYTPRLFHFTSTNGQFEAIEILFQTR